MPFDAGMLYFDARVSDHQPTLEVRVADVCLKPSHAAVIAAVTRALVETAIRKQHEEPPAVPATILRTWMWQASRYGVESELIQPRTGTPAPARDAVAQLLDEVRPVLFEYDEEETVQTVVDEILTDGPGARVQRQAYERHQEIDHVITAALDATKDSDPHRIVHGSDPGAEGTIT